MWVLKRAVDNSFMFLSRDHLRQGPDYSICQKVPNQLGAQVTDEHAETGGDG